MKYTRLKPWLVLLLGIFCISASAVFLRKAQVNGASAAFYRILFALIAIAPVFLLGKRKTGTIREKIICMFAGLFFGCELVFWNIAVMISNATMPTLLVNLSVIWTGIGASLFLKEKTGPAHWLGSALALAGVAVLVAGKNSFRTGSDRGILFSVIASVLISIYVLVTRKIRGNMDTLSVLFYALVGSLFPPLVFCIANGVPLAGYSAVSWLYLVCIGIITQAGGYFSINYALGHIDSIRVSLLTLLQPVLTAVIAWIFLAETLGGVSLAGGAIVLAGLAVSFAGVRRNGNEAVRHRKASAVPPSS